MTQQSIYLISINERAKENNYKLGKHSGNESTLISRYTTALINPIIYYFRPTTNYSIIEDKLLDILMDYRIVNNKGVYTEWNVMEKEKLINIIDKIIDKYSNKKGRN